MTRPGIKTEPCLVRHFVQERLQVFFAAMQEPHVLTVSGTERQHVDGSQTSLLSRRHKDDDWLVGRMLHDGMVARLGHRDQTRGIVSDVESL